MQRTWACVCVRVCKRVRSCLFEVNDFRGFTETVRLGGVENSVFFFFSVFPPHFCETPCCATLLKVSFFV